MSKLHTNQTESIEPRPVATIAQTIIATLDSESKKSPITATKYKSMTYLGRAAVVATYAKSKNPERVVGRRVVSRFWVDTQVLELSLITGTWSDVEKLDVIEIPFGSKFDAMQYSEKHLLNKVGK